jgi:hypothetical protein
VQTRIEISWTCQPCEVEGQDAPGDGGATPTCWNCGGPVVVTARPTVRGSPGPDRPGAVRTGVDHPPAQAAAA